MKEFIRRTLQVPAIKRRIERLYNFVNPIFSNHHYDIEVKGIAVASGPFAGIKYSTKSFGSVLIPKLLGTYECELHHHLLNLPQSTKKIIDIGCAEGYYAVGLKTLYPKSEVLAVDISQTARELCSLNAKINSLKIEISDNIREDFIKLSDNDSGLIISDCEGYEEILFDHDFINKIKQYKVIIEYHEHKTNGTLSDFVARFSQTHKTQVVQNIAYDERPKRIKWLFSSVLNDSTLQMLMHEHRTKNMHWIVAEPLAV